MSSLIGKSFLYMNGIGNKIVVLDLRGCSIDVSSAEAKAIADNGLSYDQLMVLNDPKTDATAAYVTIFNNNGSQAGACGNGTRCVAWAIMRGRATEPVAVETQRGILECRRVDEHRFTVDMLAPRLGWSDIPLAYEVPDTKAIYLEEHHALGPFCAISMGNPHAVFFVNDVEACNLAEIGPRIENSQIFPERANVSLAQVVDGSSAHARIRLRVWERDAGITRACGSGACATLVAASRTGQTGRAADIVLDGGTLFIEWRESDSHVLMTGDVELEPDGERTFDVSHFRGLSASA